nr:ATP synthase F0 subunit 8 [Leptodora kindtii]
MPQIWPMNWTILYIYFIFIFVLFLVSLYFIVAPGSSATPEVSNTKTNSLTWLW